MAKYELPELGVLFLRRRVAFAIVTLSLFSSSLVIGSSFLWSFVWLLLLYSGLHTYEREQAHPAFRPFRQLARPIRHRPGDNSVTATPITLWRRISFEFSCVCPVASRPPPTMWRISRVSPLTDLLDSRPILQQETPLPNIDPPT